MQPEKTRNRWSTILQGALPVLLVLVLGYWAWDRYHRPSATTYEGKTLEQWVEELGDADYAVNDRAADALARAGSKAVPILLEARKAADIRLHRRAVAVLVRIGEPAAPGLVAALKEGPGHGQRVETALVRMGPAAVPALTDALKDDKAGKEAAHILGLMGPRAAAAVPALLDALKERPGVAGVRAEAAETLGRIGTPSADIVPALAAALADDRPEVRRRVADGLVWIGASDRDAVPSLVVAVKDDRPEVAAAACLALGQIGDAGAVGPLLGALEGEREDVARAAGLALWQLAPAARNLVPALIARTRGEAEKTIRPRTVLATLGPVAVPGLLAALRDDDATVRRSAAEVLGSMGPPAREAVPALVGALMDSSPPVALAAALALAAIDSTRAREAVSRLADSLDNPEAANTLALIGPDARAALPSLIAALKPRRDAANDDVRRGAVRFALARIGPPAAPALLDALKDGDKDVAPQAAAALGWILPPQKTAVPALREALRKDRAHATDYVSALGQLGSTAREAVPDLADLLADDAVGPQATVAMVRIDPEQAKKVVPPLIADLKAADDKRRRGAIMALGHLGPAAKAAVPALTELVRDSELGDAALAVLAEIGPDAMPGLLVLLKDPNPVYRLKAVGLLARLGRDAREAVSPLRKVLSDPVTEVRAGAAHVVEEIGPDAAETVPYLVENLNASQTLVRANSAVALGHIGPAAKAALLPLRECLLDPDGGTRYAAALSLGRIGEHFTEGVPALRDALNDAEPVVRLAAIDSLSRIDPGHIKEVVPILVELSKSPDSALTRFRAVEGLVKLAPAEAKSAVPMLTAELYGNDSARRLNAATLLVAIEANRMPQVVLALAAALRDRDPANRGLIVRALGNLGSKAREAVPALLPLLQDGVPAVRKEAIEALRAIDPATAKRLGVG